MITLNKDNFKETISSGVTLVDFWAVWCGPCRMMNPILDKFDQENKMKAKVGKVNVDEQQELAALFGIQSIPTIIIFKEGKIVGKVIGAVSLESLTKQVESAVKQ